MDDMAGRKGENIRQAVPFVRQITQDGKPKLEVYRPTTNPIYIYTQVSVDKKKKNKPNESLYSKQTNTKKKNTKQQHF